MSNTRRRLKAKRRPTQQTPREKHIAAIQADRDRALALTPTRLRNIINDYPALKIVIWRLNQLSEAADSTHGNRIDPESSWITGQPTGDGIVAYGNTATHRNGTGTKKYRDAQQRAQRDLERVAYKLLVDLGGADGTIHHEKPRCQKSGCPEFGTRQPLGTTECLGCGKPFNGRP